MSKAEYRAFSMLEAVMALALFIIIVSSLGAYASFSLSRLLGQQAVIEAEALSEEAESIVKLIANRDWLLFNEDVQSLHNNNGEWLFAGPGTSEGIGIYQRELQVTKVCRDASQAIVDCSLGVIDPGTYQVLIKLSWSDHGTNQELSNKTYISNWRSL